MFFKFFTLNSKRERLLKKTPPGPLHDYLSTPFPEPKTPIEQVPILALDFETTGLNAVDDKLLSMGYVDVQGGHIKLASAEHYLINTNGQLKSDNVAIHQITDSEKAQGLPLDQAIEKLLSALAGKVMLAHFAKIEICFLQEACRQLYGITPVFPVIDTLALAKKRLDMRSVNYDPSELRLVNLRDTYHMPGYYAHNALNDAIATGELLLADLAHHTGQYTTLKSVLR